MKEISPEELPKLAFQLAYFLHCDRKTATKIAMRALNKLRLAATAQGKRLYYRLTGRADARKARSKVSVGEPHLLQRLVYVESEEFERRKETAAQTSQSHSGATPARQSDLVVYFIKHLVRITTRRNSFYVTLGLSRLLYNYTTPETMELYNLVIQDPDRVHDDYYYRSRKGVLLKELKERFGALLEVTKGSRGEQRWQPSEDTARHADLVRECLLQFTPWATTCVVPERIDPTSETIDQLNFQGRLADDEHEVEVNRIHATLHPACFARLTAANRLAEPDERLELPLFYLNDGHDDRGSLSRTPPNLSPDDLNTINDLLAHEALRRKAASATFFRVLVDGRERTEISNGHSATAQLRVDESDELIEVYGEDREGPLLLATYLPDFNDSDEKGSVITLEGGQQISFTTRLVLDDAGVTIGGDVIIECKKMASVMASVRGMLASLMRPTSSASIAWWKPAAGLAALALLIVGVWWTWSRNGNVNRQPDQQLVLVRTPKPTTTVTSQPQIKKPDESQANATAPGPAPKDKVNPSLSPGPKPDRTVSHPELVQNASRQPKEARDETLVERSLVADASGGNSRDSGSRGWNQGVMGKPLSQVQRIYLQAAQQNAVSQDLVEQLRAQLAGGRLQVAESDAADAALKISVRPASTRPDEKRVIAIVQAVNANGYVVWPAARRSSSARYVGLPKYVAERVVSDLNRAVQ